MSRRILWDDWVYDLSDAEDTLAECNLFFVYGTLQTFGGNNSLLQLATLIDDAVVTQDKYALGDVGFPYAFPSFIVPDQHKELLFPVKGELWKVTDSTSLLDLDMLEGHPDHYEREIVDLADGTRAWMYLQKNWKYAVHCEACHLDEGVWKWRGY